LDRSRPDSRPRLGLEILKIPTGVLLAAAPSSRGAGECPRCAIQPDIGTHRRDLDRNREAFPDREQRCRRHGAVPPFTEETIEVVHLHAFRIAFRTIVGSAILEIAINYFPGVYGDDSGCSTTSS
jgi:hypothetical protein